jgi:hypothetical protein
MKSGPSARDTTRTTTLEASVGSSSKANSPVSIKKTKNTAEELDEIVENLDLKESSGIQDLNSGENSIKSNTNSEEDFMVCHGDTSDKSNDTWKSGLELYDDGQTILPTGSIEGVHSQYQVYAIIGDSLEEFDDNNNPIINPKSIRRGANHRA